MISAQDLVEQVATIHHWTGPVSTLVEDSHLHWRPRDGALTTGELLLHIANGRLETLDTINFRPELDRGHRLRKHESAARLREVLLRTSERTLAYLRGAKLDGRVTNFYGVSVPRWEYVMNRLVEHEIHHRGQLSAYLWMLGNEPPPLFGVYVRQLPESRPNAARALD